MNNPFSSDMYSHPHMRYPSSYHHMSSEPPGHRPYMDYPYDHASWPDRSHSPTQDFMDDGVFVHRPRPNGTPPPHPPHPRRRHHHGEALPPPPGTVIEPEEGVEGEEGALAEVKDLYYIPSKKCKCCKMWVDDKPIVENQPEDEIEEIVKRKRAMTKRAMFAINRHLNSHVSDIDGGDEWKTMYLKVQSLYLRDSFAKIFENYPVTYANDYEIFLKPKYIPFHHRWDKLLQVEKEEQNPIAKEHLSLLRATLEVEMKEDIPKIKNIMETGTSDFMSLQFVYKPGDTVLFRDAHNVTQAAFVKVVNGFDMGPFLTLHLQIVKWNGSGFGVGSEIRHVSLFTGTKKISDLEVVPLSFHPEGEQIRRELIARARRLEGLKDMLFKMYSGPVSIISKSRGHIINKSISERVILDTAGYSMLEEACGSYLEPLKALGKCDSVPHGGTPPPPPPPPPPLDAGMTGTQPLAQGSGRLPTNPNDPENKETSVPPLSDTECLYCSPYLQGFLLQSKQWCQLNVAHISDIEFTPNLIDKLVLHEDEKLLTSALLNQGPAVQRFDDFVPGKGKGVVMLLCGPPGTGKTLTAESVSEHLKRPLYRVGINDLGTVVNQVETNLQKALSRCSRWGAVLLIDEADVFLERRSVDSLQRNELVSIFLRLLEYYEGVMLLTTNRSTTIDTAFESRIDIILTYSNLNANSRRQVWKNFLDELPPPDVAVSAAILDELAQHNLNGRQIKSAVKTAAILASSQGVPLGLKHLNVVINIRKRGTNVLSSDD